MIGELPLEKFGVFRLAGVRLEVAAADATEVFTCAKKLACPLCLSI